MPITRKALRKENERLTRLVESIDRHNDDYWEMRRKLEAICEILKEHGINPNKPINELITEIEIKLTYKPCIIINDKQIKDAKILIAIEP